eukprot:COSAG02_NODE_59096_length_275_cov_0.625000_1_plen_47_part_01
MAECVPGMRAYTFPVTLVSWESEMASVSKKFSKTGRIQLFLGRPPDS